MKNFVIVLIENLLLLTILPFERNALLYLWFLPIIVIEMYQLFFCKKTTNISNDDVLLKDILKAQGLECIMFILLFSFIYIIFEIIPQSKCVFPLIFILFLILNLNIFTQNIGFRLIKIKLSNDTFISKLKILINNFIIILPFYLIMLADKSSFIEKIHKPISESILLALVLNFCTRIFITKKKSLFELLLSLDYQGVK